MVLWWDSHHASQICCSKSPCPHGRPLLTHASTEDTQILKACLAQSLVGSLDSGLDVHKVLFDPSKHHWWVWGLILNSIFPSYYPVAASPLPLDEGYLFLVGSRITLSMAVQQLIAILEFSQEKMSTHFLREEERGRMGRKLIKETRKIIPILQGTATSIKEVKYTHTMLTICSPKI